MIKRLFFTLSFALINMVLLAQTTEPGLAKKEYHNITSRYNGYFNGNEILKEILLKLSIKQKDDYTKILDIFPIGTENDRKAIAGDADNVIKKASFVIQRHEIGRWVDDCYIMIGKAYYYKADFFTAIESFQYVAGKYTGDPTEVEALIWLTKCYTSLGNYEKATNSINAAKTKSGGKYRSLQFEFHKAYADLLIKTKNYRKATEELLNALAYQMPRLERARLNFILAQVYEEVYRLDRSIIFYKRAIRKTPPYEMVFNAKISVARLKDKLDTTSLESEKRGVEVMLDKMLNDIKNQEYLDQIYYTLAGIEFNKQNYPKAQELYKTSAQVSINNPIQKGLSYVAVAELNYNQFANFIEAGLYYDSTLATLPKEYPSYNDILFKRRNLDDLSRNIITIKTQDSLLAIGNMSVSEYQNFVDQQIRRILKEKEEAKRNKDKNQNTNFGSQNNSQDNLDNPSNNPNDKWYFYSPSSLSSGLSQFKKSWGDRKLEDDWRRSSKQSFDPTTNDPETITETVTEVETDPKLLYEEVTKNVPRSKLKLWLTIKLLKPIGNLATFTRINLEMIKKPLRCLIHSILDFQEINTP
jgi:tetratricopeptide (TPR) repeat protein